MRHIKILLMAAAAGVLLTSCYKRQFEPTFGNTTVEFVNSSQEMTFTGEYINIPIRMTEQSSTGAQAVVSFTGGTVTMLDGTSHDVLPITNDQEGYDNANNGKGDIIVTSYTVNIGAYDEEVDGEGLPTNNLEVRVPNYRNMQTLTMSFEIVSGNASGNTATTVVASKGEGIIIVGSYNLTPTFEYQPGQTIPPYTFSIEQDENDPSKYWFINLEGLGLTTRSLYGTLDADGTTLTIPSSQQNQEPQLAGTTIGTIPGGQLNMGDPVLRFNESGVEFTNGFWVGTVEGQSVSAYTFVNEGDIATRN